MAKGMTKTALVRHMAEKLEITNKQAAAGLELLAETAVKETKKNGEFTIPGIGKLGTGSPILGGPIVTAGGLIFIGGSMDRRFHAFSSESGKEVWSAELPASGHAQPITYQVGGRQYIVIAAGGSAQVAEEKRGDALVAFALN